MKRKALLRFIPLALVMVLSSFGAFMPQPAEAAICPEIGCVNEEYCRRDRDCTTRPGGVCNLFCPTKGCCSYPA